MYGCYNYLNKIAKTLTVFLFVVKVTIPTVSKMVYTDVAKVEVVGNGSGQAYKLTLTNGLTVYVPTQWTVIEEKQ